MPAIQLARLKIQAARLAAAFYQPAAFVHSLHTLLEFYADRTHRPGQSGEPAPLLPAYNVPNPVLRQINLELGPHAAADPAAALALADLLWAENHLECRLTAVALLNMVPPDQPVAERAVAWANSRPSILLDVLLEQGLARMRREQPARYQKLVQGWLESKTMRDLQTGLHAALPLLEDPAFENLPFIFRLAAPLARTAPAPLRQDLVALFHALAARSPGETAHFLQQNLGYDPAAWLARQVVRQLPEPLQDDLRIALRKQAAS